LLVDSFPGSVCGDRIQVEGAELQSTLTSHYNVCVVTFQAQVGLLMSERLMINFEKFNISDHSVQLTILGTARSSVSFFHYIAVTGLIYKSIHFCHFCQILDNFISLLSMCKFE